MKYFSFRKAQGAFSIKNYEELKELLFFVLAYEVFLCVNLNGCWRVMLLEWGYG